MSSVKITKIDMVEAITKHLSALGKRMTNLKSSSVDKLEEIVKKYEIDINAFVIERKALMKEQRIIDKQRKEERMKTEMEKTRLNLERNNKINNLSCVIDETLLSNKFSLLMELEDHYDWKVNGERYRQENIKKTLITDIHFEKFKKEIPPNAMLVRVDETTINVRGINMAYEPLNKKYTKKIPNGLWEK